MLGFRSWIWESVHWKSGSMFFMENCLTWKYLALPNYHINETLTTSPRSHLLARHSGISCSTNEYSNFTTQNYNTCAAFKWIWLNYMLVLKVFFRKRLVAVASVVSNVNHDDSCAAKVGCSGKERGGGFHSCECPQLFVAAVWVDDGCAFLTYHSPVSPWQPQKSHRGKWYMS